MILIPAIRRAALGICCAMLGIAHAADPLPAETQLVAASTAGTTSPTQPVTFTINPAEDLVVTLTDLEIPAELTSAGVVVTQAGAIVGSGQLAAPATNASVSMPAVSGIYTLYVFGVPGAVLQCGHVTPCASPRRPVRRIASPRAPPALLKAQTIAHHLQV